MPVMVDFGANRPERPLAELVTKKLRPGDIYTHVYSGLRGELDRPGTSIRRLVDGRKRGVIFDVGHGGGSFLWRIAVPAIKEGFLPDSISTDLHIGSMNAGMKDMLNVMDKFLAMGLSLDDVMARSTWNPAREIKQDGLGHLSVGAVADVAVLRLERGHFGLVDMNGVLTPMPCVPLTPGPWIPGVPTALLRNMPALDQSCKCMYAWGGVISVAIPGATKTLD